MIDKALIVADPWIGMILDGSKTWEMRSTGASHRGWFGLIRKGSGAVYGVAQLTDVLRTLDTEGMLATVSRHRIPEATIRSGEVAAWNTPWVLANARPLREPVPYRHRSGAVTWVSLEQDVADRLAAQVGETADRPARTRDEAPQRTDARGSDDPEPRTTGRADQTTSVLAETTSTGRGRLVGEVELTAGNIRNNHIYLRSFFDRFPRDAVGGSNCREAAAREVTVDWSGTSPVHTDLDGQRRFFRGRAWIGQFFARNDAEPGDTVVVEQTAPYAYRVRLHKRGIAQ